MHITPCEGFLHLAGVHFTKATRTRWSDEFADFHLELAQRPLAVIAVKYIKLQLFDLNPLGLTTRSFSNSAISKCKSELLQASNLLRSRCSSSTPKVTTSKVKTVGLEAETGVRWPAMSVMYSRRRFEPFHRAIYKRSVKEARQCVCTDDSIVD